MKGGVVNGWNSRQSNPGQSINHFLELYLSERGTKIKSANEI